MHSIQSGTIPFRPDRNVAQLFWREPLGPVTALCALTKGRLACSSSDRTIRLWDLEARAEIARLEGHLLRVSALCGLPEGRLASGSGDNTIRQWDMETRTETARLSGHSDEVEALA
jgi:WD40 repeat protein